MPDHAWSGFFRFGDADDDQDDTGIFAGSLFNEDDADIDPEPRSSTCCMQRVLSLQADFRAEKSMLQEYIESKGHRCHFLPKFHCEFNPIEMYWVG